MCRLIIATKKAVEDYNRKYNLLTLLEHLEKQCGGHGNGVALFSKGVCTTLVKSVKTTVEDVYDIIMRAKDYDTMIFHTRIASCGEIDDERTHPFVYGNGNVLAMNGTIHDLTPYADALGITDTEVVCKLINDTKDIKGVVKILKETSAVFVGMHYGKPYAIKNNGALEEYMTKSGFFFASSFPKDVERSVKTLVNRFSFVDGVYDEPKITCRTSSYKESTYKWDDWSYRYGFDYASLTTEGMLEERVESEEEEDGGYYGVESLVTTEEHEAYRLGYEEGYEIGWVEGLDEARAEVKMLWDN